MKDFFKYTLATVLGIVIVQAFAAILGFIMLIAISVGSQTTPTISERVLSASTSNPLTNMMLNNDRKDRPYNEQVIHTG